MGKRQNNRKKMIMSISCAVLLTLLYRLIFSFSAQSGEQSGSLSMMISEKCVAFINSITGGNWTEAVMTSMAGYFENPIRKLAHFAEYAVMGILVYGMWRPWLKPGKKLCFIVIIWLFLSAAADEVHQLFVPDRSGNLPDVLLDTLGGCFGMALMILLEKNRK